MIPEISVLPNGLRVVTDRMAHVETATIGVWVDAGARHEGAAQNGVSHLLEHMAFKGTKRRSARDIAQEIEAAGGYLNAYTAREQTCYYARVLKGDVALALDLIADILLNPALAADELAREQNVVLQEIGEAEDTPDDIIFDHLQAAAYRGQALGRPILGTVQSVKRMTPAGLRAHLKAHYCGAAMTLVASGAVRHETVRRLAQEKFQSLKKGRAQKPSPARFTSGEARLTKKLEQAHLAFALEGVSAADPDYFTAQVFAIAFGGGMSSRLFQEVREKRGLCYSISAYATAFADSGLVGVYAGTSASACKELPAVIFGELAAMAERASAEEVARAQAQAKASLLMALESPTARAEQIAGQLNAYGRVLSTAECVKRIEAADETAVRRFAGRLLRGKHLARAALGPVKALEPFARNAARIG